MIDLRTFWREQVLITRIVKGDDRLHDFIVGPTLLLQVGRLARYQTLCALIRSKVMFPRFHPPAVEMREVGPWLY